MPPTPLPELDRAVETVAARKDSWAGLSVHARIAIARQCLSGTRDAAAEMVAAACQAKGLDPHSVASGEEWLAGPVAILRNIRLLIESLRDIERTEYPDVPDSAIRVLPNGQIAVRVFPRGVFDRLMFPGTWSDVWMQPGVTQAGLRDTMAVAYHRPRDGKLALVLGAGNVASIGPMDVVYKLFVENHVVVLKMHPVNDYLGPLIERAFEPLVSDGYLRVVYGDVAEGQHLVHDPRIDEIHMTGSGAVHDRIVWGDSPEEQARRRARRDPKVTKRVTSELGCVTPVVVVPGDWSPAEIDYQAENVATMVANNASCNCNAAKLLVTWRGWPQRRAFLERFRATLQALPARRAYYPGSVKRYAAFAAHPKAEKGTGTFSADLMPWTTIFDVDPSGAGDPVFTQEAWCPIIAETALDAASGSEFLGAARRFCNERVDGTLSMSIIADGASQRRLRTQIDALIAELRYGTVAVNHWAAVSYALAVAPWGAYPGHTLDDVGSGIGFVHNTLMFDRAQKTVLWGPFVTHPKPAWFSTHRHGHLVGRRMMELEASPSWLRFAALAAAAMRS